MHVIYIFYIVKNKRKFNPRQNRINTLDNLTDFLHKLNFSDKNFLVKN